MSKHNPSQDTNAVSVALAGQLYLSHFLAAATAVTLFRWFKFGSFSSVLMVSAGIAGLVGLLLTLNIQRTIRVMDWALVHLINTVPIHDLPRRGHGPLTGLVARLHDLVERERPFTELRDRQLQQTSEAAAQEERHRLARDLHDSIKQQLFSIHVGTAAVQTRWDSDPDGGKAALADVRQSAQAALVEMNALLQQLAPEPLAKVGLVQALHEQAEALGHRTGAKVTAVIHDLPGDDRFPAGAQEALFRIAQELLSNVARHARAAQISLTLTPDAAAESLILTVSDDGQGFDVKKASEGMGLNNVRQRVEGLNGRFHLSSQPNQGTSVRVEIPLQETTQMKETRMNKPNYFFNRISLIGLGGGLALLLVLYYPLAVVLPNRWLAGWSNGSVVLGWLLALTAVPLTVGIGYWAARTAQYGRRQLVGAVAGGVATAVCYFGLGNAPLVLQGSAALWQHGLAPAASHDTFVWLLVEMVNGVIWWTMGGLVLTLAAGLILGAVGGRLAPKTTAKPTPTHLRSGGVVIAFVTVASSLLSLIVNVAVFTLLGTQVQKSAAEVFQSAGLTPSLPLLGTAVLPVGIVFLVYLAALAALLILLHRTRQAKALPQHSDIVTAYLSGFAAILLPVVVFIGFLVPADTPPAALWTVIIGCLLSLGLGLGLLMTAVSLENRYPPAANRPVWANWTAYSLYATALLLGILALLRRPEPGLLFLGVATAVHVFTRRHDYSITGPRGPILPRIIEIILSTMLAVGIPALLTVPISLGLVFTPIDGMPFIDPAMAIAPATDQTLAALAQNVYQAQPFSLLSLLIFPSILMLLVLIVAKIAEARR